MRSVAIRMVFRFPAAADRDRRRFVEFQNAGSDARDQMRAIAEGRIFCPGASAVGDAFRYLSDNGGFDEIVVGEWHGTSFPGCKDEDYSQKLRVSTTVLGMLMYHIVCKFWWERGSGEENGFHIWPRKEVLDVVEGKA